LSTIKSTTAARLADGLAAMDLALHNPVTRFHPRKEEIPLSESSTASTIVPQDI